ncbi:MAG: hypothetical protein RSB70_03435 [Clostridium sp.]
MRIICKDNLCINRPYINLKKLPLKSSLRVGDVTENGFKSTYIIDQNTESLSTNENYALNYNKGIEKIIIDTVLLNKMLLVEVNYSSKAGKISSKFKVYLVLDSIKYALPFSSFEDVYTDCMNILTRELYEAEELTYIKQSFDNLENDDVVVDRTLNLQRLQEFKDKVNYKRNVDYFVINSSSSLVSKYDINTTTTAILPKDTLKVLCYNYTSKSYSIINSLDKTKRVKLKENDIICDLRSPKFPIVSIYTNYGFGKLLDVRNNVIPNDNLISLFANLLDLGLEVLT